VNAFLAAFLLIATTLMCVALGVLSAYWAVAGLLTALNPSRPKPQFSTLVPSESSATGD